VTPPLWLVPLVKEGHHVGGFYICVDVLLHIYYYLISSLTGSGSQPNLIPRMSRQGDIKLGTQAIRAETLIVYRKEVHKFLEYLRSQNLNRKISTNSELDLYVYSYINIVYNNSKSRYKRGDMDKLLAGLQFYIHDTINFRFSKRALKSWDMLHPAEPKLPISYNIMLSLAMIRLRYNDPIIAYIYVLMFFGYLRISEASQINKFTLFTEAEYFSYSQVNCAAILLLWTKTGRNKVVQLHNPIAIMVVEKLKSLLNARTTWTFPTVITFNKGIKRDLRLLGLQDIDLTSHCFRRGGATFDFINGMRIEDIMINGRWKSYESLEHYLQVAKVLLLSLPDRSVEILNYCNQHPLEVLRLQ